MNNTCLALIVTAFCIPAAQAGEWYGSAKLNSAHQKLSDALLTSPRVTDRVSNPDSNKRISGSLALGHAFSGGWRLEGEYTSRTHANFDSHWAPFEANVNRLKIDSQRLMLNAYKDFAINDWLSFYGTLGAGVAQIDAEGYQGNKSRRFENKRQNNFAYSVGLGATAKLTETTSLGLGYRYVDMGKVETGHNSFANRINARDEQLKGKLSDQNLFVEARVAF